MEKTTISIVVLAYIIGMMYIGYYYRKQASTVAGFLATGRSIGAVVGGGALAVTYMSTASLLGTAAYAYKIGISWALFGGIGVVLGFILCMVVLGPKMRDLEVNTLPEYFERMFGPRSRAFAALVIAVVMFLYLIAQIKGGALVAKYVLDIPYPTAVLVMGAVFVLYVALGSMYAATITSFIQALILLFGVISVSWVFLAQTGWAGALAKLAEVNPAYFTSAGTAGIEFGVSFGVLMFMSILCAPHVLFRFFAATDSKVAARTSAVSTVFTGLFYFLMVIPPMAAIILAPGLGDADAAYLAAAKAVFVASPLMAGIVFAGVLAAAMSTADAMLLNASSALVFDLGKRFFLTEEQKQRIPMYLRMVTIIIGLLVIITTISPPAFIMEIMILALSMFIGSFLVPVLLGIWARSKTDTAALVAMITGLVVTVMTHPATPWIKLSQQTYAGILWTIASAVAFFVANSLVGRAVDSADTGVAG